ncbi:hypothetical protein EBR16_01240 [bacterium]|nr:hypothetical protein [bacterium]
MGSLGGGAEAEEGGRAADAADDFALGELGQLLGLGFHGRAFGGEAHLDQVGVPEGVVEQLGDAGVDAGLADEDLGVEGLGEAAELAAFRAGQAGSVLGAVFHARYDGRAGQGSQRTNGLA